MLSLVSQHVVFEPNLAELSPRGEQMLDALAPVLRERPDNLQVDGHTNQVPVKPKYFATDWDLSAARAVTVLRHLNESRRHPGERLSAVGVRPRASRWSTPRSPGRSASTSASTSSSCPLPRRPEPATARRCARHDVDRAPTASNEGTR